MSIENKLTTIAENEVKVFEAGMQTEYDRFWDSYQNNGNRVSYGSAFVDWPAEVFYPKYDIVARGAGDYMFRHFNKSVTNTSGYPPVDFVEMLVDRGIKLDLSAITSAQWMFYFANITTLPVINLSSTGSSNLYNTFYGASKLETIEEVILPEAGENSFSSCFLLCRALKNLKISGKIGKTLSFQDSPLTKASITSIINALSTTATGQTLTLKRSAVNTAFETSSGAGDGSTSAAFAALVATKTNWTITMI